VVCGRVSAVVGASVCSALMEEHSGKSHIINL
jgi:hypothetical protein